MPRRARPAAGEVPTCKVHGAEDRRLRRRGVRQTPTGRQQRWECAGDDGHHFFLTPIGTPTAPPRRHTVRCPRAHHADSRVQSKGTRTNKKGTWQRYLCIRADGTEHGFSLLIGADGSVLSSLTRPPACKDHAGSHVVRDGTYGKGANKRQRYLCTPTDGSAAHTFTPPLSRQVVHVGEQMCHTCDELLSPHRGTLTGARHTPWPLKVIVQALNELALGRSYSATALTMRTRRDVAVAHLRDAHGMDATLAGGLMGSSSSATAKDGRSAWRLAANLVEQYAPLVFRTWVQDPVEQRERRQRAANDAALAQDPQAPLAAPLTYILDEQPVVLPASRSSRAPLEQRQYSVLVVIEIVWRPAPDPMTLPSREARLRLVRAYPRGNETAWRLVLDELPVRPDFIVADCSQAISNAVASQYGAGVVPMVPSLFHVHRAVRDGLMELPGTTTRVEGRAVLIDAIAKHMDLLTREELLSREPADWASWWDELTAAVRAVPAPVGKLLEQRRLYEPRLVKALPVLRRQPQLPASNASVENRIRTTLDPFLTNRQHLYRNLARINFLFDLAVARDQGAFYDLDALTALIRQDNELADGWAPEPRRLDDPQPPRDPASPRSRQYSSLLNPHLVTALAESRLGKRRRGRPPEGSS